jgi:phage shock protein PspC (stress-responsive transcriptional regulator)
VDEDATGLHRSSDERVLAGVCGGLAHRFHLPPIVPRIVLLFIPIWPLWLVLYIIAAASLPERPTRQAP